MRKKLGIEDEEEELSEGTRKLLKAMDSDASSSEDEEEVQGQENKDKDKDKVGVGPHSALRTPHSGAAPCAAPCGVMMHHQCMSARTQAVVAVSDACSRARACCAAHGRGISRQPSAATATTAPVVHP